MPIVYAGFTAVAVMIYIKGKRYPESYFKPMMKQVLLMVYFMTFYEVVYRLSFLIRCRDQDGLSFSYLLVDESCYSTDQIIVVFCIALPYFIGFFILLPVLFWRTIRKPENKQPLFNILKHKWSTELLSR